MKKEIEKKNQFWKKRIWPRYRYRNWTLVSVSDTETKSTYSINPRTFAERNAEAIDVSRDQTKRQRKSSEYYTMGPKFL